MNPLSPFALLSALALVGYMILRQQNTSQNQVPPQPRKSDSEDYYEGEPIGV